MSLTRTATVRLARGARTVIGVGRVKTRTLAIVCKRELEIRNFVAQAYFEVVATTQAEGGRFRTRLAPRKRILKCADAEAIAAAAVRPAVISEGVRRATRLVGGADAGTGAGEYGVTK